MSKSKKIVCLILSATILLLLPSCSSTTTTPEKATKVSNKTATPDEVYPYPSYQNWEESDNSTGARFKMTLKEYTEAFNKMYNSLGGGSQEIDYSKWENLSSGQVDENGVAYDYYYYANDKAVLTATVEQESGKLMNIGCGTTVSVFVNEKETQYQTIILAMTGIMACVAGGYTVDDVTFFADLYVDTISSTNNSFWYNNGIYLLSVEEEETNEDSTMLFRVVAATDEIEEEWHLVNYKTFLQENTEPETGTMPTINEPSDVAAQEESTTQKAAQKTTEKTN